MLWSFLAYSQELGSVSLEQMLKQSGALKQGVSIENKNQKPVEWMKKKEEVVKTAFEDALRKYTEALAFPGINKLKKTIGPVQAPVSLGLLNNISLTVQMLDEEDAQKFPMTWEYGFLKACPMFVTKIPYRFLEDADETRIQHFAMNVIGHLVAGHRNWDLAESADIVEQQTHEAECLTCFVVGTTKYKEFLRSRFRVDRLWATGATLEKFVEDELKAHGLKGPPEEQ